jgi:hypothetical protein
MRLAAAILVSCGLMCFPASAQDKTAPAGAAAADAMIFFLARGPAGACGPGCSEWIAAEGVVQWDSHKRLLALLDRVADRKLPVILRARGEGNLNVAVSLGRIIRGRGLDVSAGSTIAAKCAGAAAAECLALKRSGAQLEARLDVSSVECDMVCVLVLAGGVRRTLPPAAQVVVAGMQIRNRLAPNVSDERREGLQSLFSDQFRLYLTQMGVNAELVDIIDRNSKNRSTTRLRPEDWTRLGLVTERPF